MIFNGYDFSPYLTVNMSRRIMPGTTLDTVEVPGKPGVLLRSNKLEPVTIPVTLRLKAGVDENIADLRHILAGMLYTERPEKLILPDDEERYYMAVATGDTTLSKLWYTGVSEAEFYCADPLAYGKKGYISVPSVDFTIGGTYETKPIITCHPAANTTFIKITNDKTGEFMQINRSFDGTETVVFDCEKEQATVNGINAAVVLASDFFALKPGVNALLRSSGTFKAEWRERWM